MARSLARDKLNSFPIVRFISFVDGKLLLLIGGKCPVCESVHIRNICNAQFVAELVEPRLQFLFSNISQVKAMMSSRNDFARTVDDMGGRIVGCVDRDTMKSRMELQRLMCDFHPNISCTIKGLTQIPDGEIVDEVDDITTREVFSSFFNVSYFIDESFKYVQPNGVIRHSYTVGDGSTLPENSVYVDSEDSPCPFLSSTHPSFFNYPRE